MEPVKKKICSPEVLSRVFYALDECDNAVPMSIFTERLTGFLTPKQTRSLIEKLCKINYLVPLGKGRYTRYGRKLDKSLCTNNDD